jgi:hypothetical protein
MAGYKSSDVIRNRKQAKDSPPPIELPKRKKPAKKASIETKAISKRLGKKGPIMPKVISKLEVPMLLTEEVHPIELWELIQAAI